jgi:hypothetical protein
MGVGILLVAGLIFAYIVSYFREEMERDSENSI